LKERSNGEKKCSVEQCKSKAMSMSSKCSKHYRESRRLGMEKGTVDRCTVNGCIRPKYARGWCEVHYPARLRATHEGREVRNNRRNGECEVRDSEGRKMCIRCKEWMQPDYFGVNPKTRDKRQPHCRMCNRLKMYGITNDQYLHLIKIQNNRCAICGSSFDTVRVTIDHDHECCGESSKSCGKCIRGLLCGVCNTGLGAFGDKEQLVEKALEYLRRKR
jgi:hypothetical protein